MMKRKVGFWLVILVCGGFAVYDFWDGYHPARSIAAGAVCVILGLLENLFDVSWPPLSNKSKSDRTVI
jgi:hypothetical protein